MEKHRRFYCNQKIKKEIPEKAGAADEQNQAKSSYKLLLQNLLDEQNSPENFSGYVTNGVL